MKKFFSFLFLFFVFRAWAGVDVNYCPNVFKRNNGNGQASSAAGNFAPYAQNNPVAANVVGTTYQNVPFNPTTKTGNWNLYWDSQTPIVNLPVITRCWYAPNNSTASVLSPIVFGPPPPPTVVGNRYYANYCYYVQNMPNIGIVTFEFTDPNFGSPVFYCSFDLSSNASTVKQVPCAPTISAHPVSQNLCVASGTASFSVTASGYNSVLWQESLNGSSWTNLSNGGNYSGVTSTTLVLSNPASLSGRYYRARLTATGTSTYCSSTETFSNSALLTANPAPSAVFTGSSTLCGLGSRNLTVDFTGTAPWTFKYTVNGGSEVTVSNVLTDPYSFSVSPAASTTYTLTYVSDRNCVQSSLTGQVTVSVAPVPTITPGSPSICQGATSMSLTYSSTGSPNQYTLSAGTRILDGFTGTSGSLTASPLSISIPGTETDAGQYDFSIVATNSSTGCSSAAAAFILNLSAKPTLYLSGGENTICANDSVRLLVAPSNLSTYVWSSSPSSSVASIYNPWVRPSQTTTYTLTATNSTGCSATASKTVTVAASPTITVTPASATICAGNAVSLVASGSNTYSWSPSTGLSATSGANVVATPASTTTYTVSAQNVSGCSSSATVTVTVNAANITATANGTICSGAVRTLTASGGSTYVWYPVTDLFTNSGATTAYTGTSLATVYAKPAATTTYYVEGTTTAGCKGIASSTVTVSGAPINSNVDSTTAQNLVFCTQGITSFPLNVKTTSALDSARWFYSVDGVTYTAVFGATSPSGVTLTPSTSGTSPNVKYTLTLSAYSSGGYGGPRYFRLAMYSSSTCNSNYNIFITDTKASGAGPAPSASQYTICNGNSIALSIGTLQSGSTVQWQSSTDSAAWGNISLATAATYVASPGATTFYRVVYNGGNGNCGNASAGRKITVVSALASNTVTPSTSCTNGSSNISLTGSAITSGQYQWMSSTTSSTSGFSDILGATSQNYTLPVNIVSSNTWYRRIATNGTCFRDTSVAVVVYPPINTNTISAATLSYCGTTASATLITGSTPSGGSGTFTYQWMQSTNGTSFTNVSSGGTSKDFTTSSQSQSYWYKRVVTSGGCNNDTSGAVKISLNPLPVAGVTASATDCYEHPHILTASGGVSYSWSPATFLNATTGETVISTPQSTTTYTVTVTSAYGCTASASTTVTVISLPATPTLSSSAVTVCSGSIDLNSYITSGGTNNWYLVPDHDAAYAVSTPSSVSAARTYYVFAVVSGCKSDNYASLTLSRHDTTAPVPSANALTYCAPATVNLSLLQAVAISGAQYRWSTSNSSPASNLVADATQVTVSGTYYLYSYSTAGNCYGNPSSSVSLNIYSRGSVSTSTSSVSVCAPASVNLNSYYTSSGGNTYDWYSSAQTILANKIANPGSVSTAGKYYVFATSAQGCTGSPDSIQLVVNPVITDSISSPSVSCNNGALTLDAFTNGNTYSWQLSTDGGATFSNVPASSPYSGVTTSQLSISSTSGLGGNFYRCYLTNSSTGCFAYTDQVSLVTENTPSVTDPLDARINSLGDTSFSVSLSGTPVANFKWQVSLNNGSTFIDVQDDTTYFGSDGPIMYLKRVPANFSGRLYRCIAYNSCGSDTSSSATLIICSTVPSVSVTGLDSVCSGQSTTYTASSGASYFWNTSEITPSITVTSAGTYSVTVTNSNGCTATASRSLSVNSNPTVGISGNNSICSGSSSVFTASGGGTYLWNTAASTSAITVSAAGTYTVTVTNGSGCTATASRLLTVNSNPTAGISGNNSICSGSSSVFTASGGGTYLWNTGDTSSATTVSAAGTYTVTVTNGSGCTATASRSLTVNSNPSVGISGNNSICSGSSSVFTASGGGTYLWNTGDTSSATTVSAAGTYTVTVTNGSGCTATASRSLTVNSNPLAVISGTSTICSGTGTTLTGSGGSLFSWSTGDTTVAISVSPVNTTTYRLTVTTAQGCSGYDSVLVNVNNVPDQPGNIIGTSPVCANSVQTYSVGVVSGATSYNWSVPAGWTLLSGQGNDTIEINTGSSDTLISVKAVNNCGEGTARTLIVGRASQVALSGITADTATCPDDVVPVYVTGYSGTAVSLSWYSGANASGTLLGTSDTIYKPTGTYYAHLTGTCGSVDQSVNVTSASYPSNNVYLSPTVTGLAFDECVQGGWTYYAVTSESQYLFAIRKNGNVFDSRTHITVVEQPQSAPDTAITSFRQNGTAVHASYLMRRYWNVEVYSGSDTFPTPVDVRFYYDPADSVKAKDKRDSVQALYTNTTLAPWKWFKTVGVQFNPSLINGNDFTAFPNIELTPYAYGTENGVRYVQFNGITSFSGGGGGFGFTGGSGALPVKMLSFNASSKSNAIVLDWSTQTEINNRGWFIERSTDGDHFESIGWTEGNGSSTQLHQYQYVDAQVVPAQLYYYRLKQIDADGNWSYSRTVSAVTGEKELILGELYPNPSNGSVQIPILRKGFADLRVEVRDALGRVILVQTTSKLDDKIALDCSGLNSGLYYVVINNGSEKHLRKLRLL